MALGGAQRGATPPRSQEVGENAKAAKKSAMQSLLGVDLFGAAHGAEGAGKRRPTGLEVAASDEPFVFAAQTYEGSLIVLGCKLALAVPTVQQAWASSGVRAGDRIVAVNGTAGPAEKLLSLLRRDNKKRRLTLVRPQAEEGLGWRDSVRARRKLFV